MLIKNFLRKWVWDKWVFPSFFHPKPRVRPVQASTASGFYELGFYKNDGTWFSFDQLKGKNVIILNTASACGYTNQYADWEQFYQQNKLRWEILAFPSNQFLGQESGSDAEIAKFCDLHFNLSFPLFRKSDVRGKSMNAVYQWLTDPVLNGWNKSAPAWNFNKYVIDQNGQLQAFFPSKTKPQDETFIQIISRLK